MEPPEIITVEKTRIKCDGGGGPLGHPQVFYTITEPKRSVDCGYCGRRFTLREGVKATDHH